MILGTEVLDYEHEESNNTSDIDDEDEYDLIKFRRKFGQTTNRLLNNVNNVRVKSQPSNISNSSYRE